MNNASPYVFNTEFSFSSYQHNIKISSSLKANVKKLFYKTNRYGKYSVTVSTIESCKKIQKQLKDMLLKDSQAIAPHKFHHTTLLTKKLNYSKLNKMHYLKGNTSRFGSAIQVLLSDIAEYLSSLFNAIAVVVISIFIL